MPQAAAPPQSASASPAAATAFALPCIIVMLPPTWSTEDGGLAMPYCLGWTLGKGMQDHHEEAHTGSPTALRGDRPDKCPRPGTAGMLGAICIRQWAGRRRCMPAMANGIGSRVPPGAARVSPPPGHTNRAEIHRGRGASQRSTRVGWVAIHGPARGPGGAALLLDSLRGIGAAEQAAALADRAATHGPLNDPGCVARLLDIQEAGADGHITILAGRLPSTNGFGREVDGRSAAPWGWDDLDL